MKKGQIYEGRIQEVEFPNKGKIFIPEEEKTVVVKNGAPGQLVRFSVNKIRKGKAEGRILEVLEPAANEITPPCPHFGQCGGCTYQNLPYEEQLQLKETQIRNMMDEAVDGEYIWKGSIQAPGRRPTAIRWSFPLEMSIKTGRWLSGCIKEAVSMILSMCRNAGS